MLGIEPEIRTRLLEPHRALIVNFPSALTAEAAEAKLKLNWGRARGVSPEHLPSTSAAGSLALRS